MIKYKFHSSEFNFLGEIALATVQTALGALPQAILPIAVYFECPLTHSCDDKTNHLTLEQAGVMQLYYCSLTFLMKSTIM